MQKAKLKKNNTIYVDIGYTNIKYLKNDKIFINSVNKAKTILTKLSQKYFCIVACNNNSVLHTIQKLKNIKIVTYLDFIDEFKCNEQFIISELGIDLILIWYWCYVHHLTDALVISSGSFLVCVVIKNQQLEDLSILAGYLLEKQNLQTTLKTGPLPFVEQTNNKNINSVFHQSFIDKIQGMLEINKKKHNIDKNIYLSGNYFKKFAITKIDIIFKKTTYIDNIVLCALKLKYENF